ncbi:MAG: S49 family peptidase [Alphaproteobacteria bacterium]|nr:S49 family peptidase [Alphaproteobacteria bacterium]
MHIPFLSKSRPVVSVVRLSGVIGGVGRWRGGLTLASMAGLLERAFRARGTRAVALDINSPGGSPVQSALIYKRIRALAAEHKVPVFSFAQDVAASGGYWLALAGDRIYADDNSIIGSIGVISGGFGFQDFLDRHGIERRLHVSGEHKSFLDPFLPEKEEDVSRLARLQADVHDRFKEVVRERRRGQLKSDEATLFSGEFWTGRRAVELGLVDAVGDLRGMMRAEFGDKVRLRLFASEGGWLRRRLGLVAPSRLTSVLDDLMAGLETRALWARFGL